VRVLSQEYFSFLGNGGTANGGGDRQPWKPFRSGGTSSLSSSRPFCWIWRRRSWRSRPRHVLSARASPHSSCDSLSNIFDLGIALGGAAMSGSLLTHRKLVWRDALALVGSSFLPFALVGFDLTLGHLDGRFFFTLLAGSLWVFWIPRRDKSHPPPPRRVTARPPGIP
jgi:hypothetical protein